METNLNIEIVNVLRTDNFKFKTSNNLGRKLHTEKIPHQILPQLYSLIGEIEGLFNSFGNICFEGEIQLRSEGCFYLNGNLIIRRKISEDYIKERIDMISAVVEKINFLLVKNHPALLDLTFNFKQIIKEVTPLAVLN
ncbi:MAG: hypothetical protein MUF50_00850 [Planctomycetes bacterium]|jgi:hypothetical protein|nr:hypothetical protein [Planctomycetota bacterium]